MALAVQARGGVSAGNVTRGLVQDEFVVALGGIAEPSFERGDLAAEQAADDVPREARGLDDAAAVVVVAVASAMSARATAMTTSARTPTRMQKSKPPCPRRSQWRALTVRIARPTSPQPRPL